MDPFTAEIFRSYLISTVREMVVTTTRTAFSTCFCHGEDFTCALFDDGGRMIAQDQGVTVHTGAMEEVVRLLIAKFPSILEGDVFVHNDPYNWGTHQADGLVCRPIFYRSQLAGFSANRGHWTDIGGMSPGGWSGTAQDVVQEGLIIPECDLSKVVDWTRRSVP
jgi:N-methylhydantoinase B/oxoprolinase/acetone carboxylase alpha subunit